MKLIALIQGWCPWCGQHMGWWGGFGMMLGWLIVLVAVVALVWLLLRRSGGGSADRAEDVLRERYARGEIDDETYRRMRAELRQR